MRPTAIRASFLLTAIGTLRDVEGDFRAAKADDLAQETRVLLERAELELAMVQAQQAEELRGLEDAGRE